MSFLILIFLLFLQSTFLAVHCPFLRPDLPLVFLILVASGRGWVRGFAWGALTGLLLDLFMGGSINYFLLYSLLGLVFGFISGDFFKSYKVLVVFNIFLATVLVYFLLSHFSLLELNFLGLKFCFKILGLNIVYAWGLSFLLAPFLGIKNEE